MLDQTRLIGNLEGGGDARKHKGTRDPGKYGAALAEEVISIIKGHGSPRIDPASNVCTGTR
jgi:hypothetical protein